MAAASVSSVSLPAIENAIREVCCALSGKTTGCFPGKR